MKTKNNPRVPIKKIEDFSKGALYGFVYMTIQKQNQIEQKFHDISVLTWGIWIVQLLQSIAIGFLFIKVILIR